MNDWQVRLVENQMSNRYDVFFRRKADNRVEFLTKGGLEIVTIENQRTPESDVTFASLEFDQLKALVEEFSNKGFKTANDHKIEGLLEATKNHLEDMRLLALQKVKR